MCIVLENPTHYTNYGLSSAVYEFVRVVWENLIESFGRMNQKFWHVNGKSDTWERLSIVVSLHLKESKPTESYDSQGFNGFIKAFGDKFCSAQKITQLSHVFQAQIENIDNRILSRYRVHSSREVSIKQQQWICNQCVVPWAAQTTNMCNKSCSSTEKMIKTLLCKALDLFSKRCAYFTHESRAFSSTIAKSFRFHIFN